MGAAMISPSKQPKPLGEATGEATGEAKDEAKGEDRGEAKGEATGEATAVGLPGGLPGRRTRRQASGGRRGGGRSVGPCPGSRGEGKEGEEGEGEEEADDSGVDSGHWATESDAEEATVAAGSVATSVGKAYLGSSSGGGYGYGSRAAQTPLGDDEDPPLCYVCCDDAEVGPSNPLVSACACTGGTRWLHLACLDRLLSGGSGPDDAHAAPCVMFRNQNRNFVCKVCRSEYRTHCELLGSWNPDGSGPVVVPIPQPSLRPPYLCFKVVTHNAHNAFADSIFNSTFHVSFAGLVDPAALQAAAAEGAAGGSAVGLPAARRSLVIGRSLEADMQLNYQTVSGHHAALHFSGTGFQLSDLRSSNGTFLYLREPLQLVPGQPVRVSEKKGRSPSRRFAAAAFRVLACQRLASPARLFLSVACALGTDGSEDAPHHCPRPGFWPHCRRRRGLGRRLRRRLFAAPLVRLRLGPRLGRRSRPSAPSGLV
jgi:hypothetical protein